MEFAPKNKMDVFIGNIDLKGKPGVTVWVAVDEEGVRPELIHRSVNGMDPVTAPDLLFQNVFGYLPY